ncbi:MAG: hypothetical protein HC904_15315 [Blastochloris sp.]|nr:hypothetical protein [Blastochloris sp.]
MNEVVDLPMMEEGGGLVLFYPHISERVRKRAYDQLGMRWIGQGPALEQFEWEFSKKFCAGRSTVAVGSGTDGLHLAYLLAGIKSGDEVALSSCSLWICAPL